MVRLDINNGTQHDMCLDEIGLRAQDLSTILDPIVNMTVGT